MPFEAKKYSELVETMRDRMAGLSDFEVGSVARNMAEAFSYELSALYEKMFLAYLAGFVDTAEGMQLDRVVAVLGIERNLPDYAEGTVTFFRDTGGPDIAIPIGTLVATEDSEEKPKKAYLTLEEKTLAAADNSVEVKVRAFHRGAEQVTPAETIIVMPSPIPGIKAVNNDKATRFTGKGPEPDTSLRQRAKNALIASGKATIPTLVNALLATPGIKEAQVKEYFHFARGKVELEYSGNLILPVGTKFTIKSGANSTEVRLLNEVRFIAGQSTQQVKVESLKPGLDGELLFPITPDLVEGLPADVSFKNVVEPIALDSFGVIHVIIDGIEVDILQGSDDETVKANQERLANRERIFDLIKKWRAAGIYPVLKNAEPIQFGGIFKIEIDPSLKLSAEDRRAYEKDVEAAIQLHLDKLRMGETLKFPKLIQQVLDVDGIENLEDLRIVTTILNEESKPVYANTYALSDNQIPVGDEARFYAEAPGYICVASETKELLFDIEFKYIGSGQLEKAKPQSNPSPGQTSVLVSDFETKITAYLNSTGILTENGLKGKLEENDKNDKIDKLKIKAYPWSPRPVIVEDFEVKDQDQDANKEKNKIIDISFVEKPSIRKLFIYQYDLNITGALKLKLPGFYTQETKDETINKVKKQLDDYLDALPREHEVDLAELEKQARFVQGVLDATALVDDFQARREDESAPDPARINDTKKTILVKEFEKANFEYLCIAPDIATLRISLTQLEISVSNQMPATDIVAIKTALASVFNTTSVALGEAFSFNNLNVQLESAKPGLQYTISKMALEAKSLSDGRTQTRNLKNTADIHVRSVELPVIIEIKTAEITEKTV